MTATTPSQKPKELSVQDLLQADRYQIPYYQRDYAWDRPHVEQLIQDVRDSWQKSAHAYYIGTLVVDAQEPEKGSEISSQLYETIDGQQRLTTLHVMWGALKPLLKAELFEAYRLNLEFACRDRATYTLHAITSTQTQEISKNPDANHVHKGIWQAYRHAFAFFKNWDESKEGQLDAFAAYLLQHVKIIRVQVPKDTDLNHYFETMNSRGEQLEKHEILKARLMSKLNPENYEQSTFKRIWEACADMGRYVQMGFGTDNRTRIWGETWDKLAYTTFEEFNHEFGKFLESQADDESDSRQGASDPRTAKTLEEMIKKSIPEHEDTNNRGKNSPDRFQSPIDFPNFLLQVLRLHWHHHKSEYKKPTSDDVALDDKSLIKEFERTLLDKEISNHAERIKKFAFDLLWLRWKMDSCILKRDYSGNRPTWSLWMLRNRKDGDKNQIRYTHPWKEEEEEQFQADLKSLVMVQSMFHVTFTGYAYKHWLTGSLNYIYQNREQGSFPSENYLQHLEEMARSFMFDHYLGAQAHGGSVFHSIVFHGARVSATHKGEMDEGHLHKGVGVPHFVFNYLDYLLWKDAKASDDGGEHLLTKDEVAEFEFIYRNSVEHFYPQHPHDDWYLDESEEIHEKNIDRFGNLCIIGRSDNSRLNNHLPDEKVGFFTRIEKPSLKLMLMKKSAGNWRTTEDIEAHEKLVLAVLQKDLALHHPLKASGEE